jgi:hypothetical protein
VQEYSEVVRWIIKSYDELIRISFRISAYDRANISKINLNLPPNFLDSNRALFNALMKDPGFNSDMYNVLPTFKFPVLIVHGASDVLPQRSIDRLKKGTTPRAPSCLQ